MAFVMLEDIYGSMELLLFPKVLAQYSHLITEGNIVRVVWKIEHFRRAGYKINL